jgi:DNA mismatch repair ATPase MutL
VTVIPARVDPPRAAARVLGEARSGLLVAEDDLGLLVIDRQATRELSTLQALGGNAPPQPLLIPARLDLAPHEAAALTARLGDLQALGVWIEPFGGPTFQLLGIPPAALGASPVRLLEAVASLCGARGEHDAEAVRRVIASVAATSRDGSAESRDQLVADALAVGGEARDHRGRRAFVRLTPTELTRRFET